MDAIELLAREDEFKRLNKQLEKKTESLMKEIEHVMQKQDFFTEFSPSLSLPTRQNFKKHCCTPPSQPDTPIKRNYKKRTTSCKKVESPKSLDSDESEFEPKSLNDNILEPKSPNTENENLLKGNCEFDRKPQAKKKNESQKVVCACCPQNRNTISNDLEFLYAFVNLCVKDKVLPPSFSKEDRVSVESVYKFLSSKIKLMQEQIDKLQNTIEKKASQCESHLTQLAELESERMGLLNNSNNMKSNTAEMRAKYLATQKRLEEKDKLYKEARSEADKQSSELTRLRSKNASVEAKCASLDQLVDSLRHQLDTIKRTDKEHRESARQLSSTYDSAISRYEQQVTALTARSDKQAALIRNLRKQCALLSTDGAVRDISREYNAFLEQDL